MWLFPVALALHVAEEANGFTEWVNRHASEAYSARDFVRINALGLILSLGATVLVTHLPARCVFGIFYTAFVAQQALSNPLFHLGSTAAYREYSPGLATSLLLFLPLWYSTTRRALRERALTPRAAGLGSAVGSALHAAVVAKQVYGVELRRPGPH